MLHLPLPHNIYIYITEVRCYTHWGTHARARLTRNPGSHLQFWTHRFSRVSYAVPRTSISMAILNGVRLKLSLELTAKKLAAVDGDNNDVDPALSGRQRLPAVFYSCQGHFFFQASREVRVCLKRNFEYFFLLEHIRSTRISRPNAGIWRCVTYWITLNSNILVR